MTEDTKIHVSCQHCSSLLHVTLPAVLATLRPPSVIVSCCQCGSILRVDVGMAVMPPQGPAIHPFADAARGGDAGVVAQMREDVDAFKELFHDDDNVAAALLGAGGDTKYANPPPPLTSSPVMLPHHHLHHQQQRQEQEKEH